MKKRSAVDRNNASMKTVMPKDFRPYQLILKPFIVLFLDFAFA